MSKSRQSVPQYFPQPKLGIVDKPITATICGRVKFDGSYWFAKFVGNEQQLLVNENDSVFVVGRVGGTLLVKTVCTSSEDNLVA
jgi:membrane protein implicated in regulation of membrane protease activity